MMVTSEVVRALGAQLITDELIVFPVRHHSPACAWQLLRLFSERKPSVVLLEGPRNFTSLIPLLVHPEAQMPLAVYTYTVQNAEEDDKPLRRAAYYPFCNHSPELVALHAANERGIPARFIDLDFAEQCLLEPDYSEGEANSLLSEPYYRNSGYLSALAKELGCRNHEELWEHLFEVSVTTRSLQEYVGDMVAYCHLARIECSAEDLTKNGTLHREAEMAWHIRQALNERKSGDGPVLAVVGGFHAVVMPSMLEKEVARPPISRSAVSDESFALIRYSYDQLDRLNGYSAGMPSPVWQQLLWENLLKYDKARSESVIRGRNEAALTMLIDIAVELRKCHNVTLPMPTVAAAFEHALQLALLRRRSAPVREDVLDAVISCFVKGDADAEGVLVKTVASRIFSGQLMGKVPPGAGTPPLVKDFHYRARRQRLKIDDSQQHHAVLDIYRRPKHRLTSRLLHGLSLLDVPLAVCVAGPDFVNRTGLDRLQEQWEYAYSVATESALVEASVYGVTVPLAVANRFRAQLDQLESNGDRCDARTAVTFLVRACVLGLHDFLPRINALLLLAISEDAIFESVVAAASNLGLLWESREPLEARNVTEVLLLLGACYERAIYLGHILHSVSEDNQGLSDELLEALSRLRELLVSGAGHTLDASLYWNLIVSLSTEHPAALIRGAATGLLYCAGQMSEAQVGIALDGHLNGLITAHEAISFLRGLLYLAREVAWQQPALLDGLDKLLKRWDDEAFLTLLPELRLVFAGMTPKETDRIAQAVAQLYGKNDLGCLIHYDLSAAEVQSNLELSCILVKLLIADGLHDWCLKHE
jgi:hypothetical protein